MTHLPLALSLTSSFTKVGAIVAFAALVATAILSLLVFSQARELKRLREWAGRAPERAAELEQRVSSYAAARVQHTTGVAETVRPMPVAPPVTPVPAPPGAAAAAAEAAPAAEPTPAGALPGTPPTVTPPNAEPGSPAEGAPGVPAPAGSSEAAPRVAAPLTFPAEAGPGVPAPVSAAAQAGSAQGTPAVAAPAGSDGEDHHDAESFPAVLGPASAAAQAGVAEGTPAIAPPEAGLPSSAAGATPGHTPLAEAPPAGSGSDPLTAAGVAGGSAALGPVGQPDGDRARVPVASPAAAAASIPLASAEAPVASSSLSGETSEQRPPARPQAPARPASSARPPAPAPRRAAAAPAPRVPDAGARAGRRGAAPAPPRGRSGSPTRYGGSPGRATAMIIGAVLVAVVAIVVVVKVLGGSSSSGTATTPALISSAKNAITQTSATHGSSEASTPAVSPAETTVTVLNGTETSGLAHRFAENLQQGGYTKANALRGSPPGSHQTSVVEYSSGHRAEAKAVAKSISVSDVRSLESGVAGLSSGANVVVIVGADKASSATSGAGEESSAGTAASG